MGAAAYRIRLVSADEAREIAAWRYDGPYAVYNMGGRPPSKNCWTGAARTMPCAMLKMT